MAGQFVTKNIVVLRKFFFFSDTCGARCAMDCRCLVAGRCREQTAWGLSVDIPDIELGTWESQENLTILGQEHFKCFLNKTISNHFLLLPQWNFACSAAGNL